MIEQNAYNIIWKHFSKESKTGTHLNATEDFSLPYFLDGIEKGEFEKKLPIDLNIVHLLKGLLVGYFDKPPGIDTSFAQNHAKIILNNNLEMFQCSTVEDFIIDLSNLLRENNGQIVSLQSLSAGVEIEPDSHAIKYDCCIDLHNCIEDDELSDKAAAISKIKLLINDIDASKLNEHSKDGIAQLKDWLSELGS